MVYKHHVFEECFTDRIIHKFLYYGLTSLGLSADTITTLQDLLIINNRSYAFGEKMEWFKNSARSLIGFKKIKK